MNLPRRLLAVLALAALLPTVASAEPNPVPLVPLQHGYAFEQPAVLVRQRLFGLAHGVSLLAASCVDLPSHADSVEAAYAIWHRAQREAIDDVVHALAAHYFGPRADEAEWDDLVRALQLKSRIDDVLGDVPLADACATLPQALTQPRYDLARTLAEESTTDDPRE